MNSAKKKIKFQRGKETDLRLHQLATVKPEF